MKALQRNFYFFTTVLALSSCASFENLTDDRTRAEDDEMYWNGKELFYDHALVAAAESAGDDYYDPNSVGRSNSMNGGTNPRATFNPISGWQLSYGLNAFSNYSNGFGMGLGYGSYNPYNSFGNNSFGYNPYGYNSYGYNPYGYNSYGYNPYSSYNGFGGGYGYNPYGYGMGGLGWGGYGNGWFGNGNGNGWGGSGNNGESVNVTHHHRRPTSVATGNSSTYHRGVLQKNLVQPIAETSRTPKPVAPSTSNGNYGNPSYSRGGTPEYTTPSTSPARSTASPSRTSPNYNTPTYASPSRSTPTNTSPSHSSPSRSTPSYSSPSHSSSPSPSRSTPTHSAPTHSAPTHSAPTRTSSPSHSTPSHSSPSRSTSPGKRP
jgi:hypothetical protein